jgi:hypothetical protein
MAAHILAISDRGADVTLAQFIASQTGLKATSSNRPQAIQEFLLEHPQAVVIWDTESYREMAPMAKILYGRIVPHRVFAVTDGPINQYPHLFDFPIFGHHLQRRFMVPAPELYTRLVVAALTPAPFGIGRYFPKGTPTQKINLRRSSHKNAAVEALNSFLTKRGVTSRLAQLAAQATDELIMNAVFDAPIDAEGRQFRRELDRNSDFELRPEPGVDIEIACTNDYSGISVADTYGSFKRTLLMNLLKKDYQERAYVVKGEERGAGLGVHGLIQSGLSILFVCKAGFRTEVMVFFPNSKTYKEFKAGPRFLSLLME